MGKTDKKITAMSAKEKIYPESGVELTPFMSKHYDSILALASMGHYPRSIKKAIGNMDIRPDDHILDMGCGTGYNSKLMSAFLNSKGQILGMDISDEMARQFRNRFAEDERVSFMEERIDQPFYLNRKFDKILISFVFHGFPHEVREVVIHNALAHLKEEGSFYILDFAEFEMNSMPPHHRFIFKAIECPYAFDYIARDWKSILKEDGFNSFTEYFYLKNYMRLLRCKK